MFRQTVCLRIGVPLGTFSTKSAIVQSYVMNGIPLSIQSLWLITNTQGRQLLYEVPPFTAFLFYGISSSGVFSGAGREVSAPAAVAMASAR